MPNWIEEKELLIPTWFDCKNLVVEIKHLNNLIKIRKSLGKLIDIDSDYGKNSNVKFLIDIELDQGKMR